MYRLFLAIRYLLTRPVNLLGVGGITISVWALVVVVSLFSGFLQVIEKHVQSASSDIVVSGLPRWSEWHALREQLLDDPNVASLAPRLTHYGLLLPTWQAPGAGTAAGSQRTARRRPTVPGRARHRPARRSRHQRSA